MNSQQPHKNSNQFSADDDDISTLPCPLDLQSFRKDDTEKQSIELKYLKEVEQHVQYCKNCPHPQLKDIIFENPREPSEGPYKSYHIRGSLSPLHKACFYGELESVKRIIECWKVDVNLPASYCPFYGGQSMIDKATPLFVAATMGHLEVVRYLVEVAGADMSAKTSDTRNIHCSELYVEGWTPLYGAVVWGHSGHGVVRKSQPFGGSSDTTRENRSVIVRALLMAGAAPTFDDLIRSKYSFPLWMSELIGIEGATPGEAVNYADSFAALVDYGLDLNRRTLKGDTILHHFSSWPGVGACIEKEELLGVVQLLLNRMDDPHSKGAMGFTPIMRSAYDGNFDVLDFLLDRNDINREEKINALELAGAVQLRFGTCSVGCKEKAYHYWYRSLQLRLDTDGCGPMIKARKILKSGRVKEWVTLEEMEDVVYYSSEHQIQSFRVGMRILSGISWDAVKDFIDEFGRLLWPYSRYIINYQPSIKQKIHVLWETLDTICCFDVRENDILSIVLSTVERLIQTLQKLGRDDPLMNDETMKTSYELILKTEQFHLKNWESINPHCINKYTRSMFQLTKMLTGLPKMVSKANMEILSKLVRNFDRYPCKSLLHMACDDDVPGADRLPTIRLLLGAGANPDEADSNGNRPLHYLAKLNGSSSDCAARLLLEAGAYPDRRNKEEKTAADIWIENHPETRKRNISGDQRATQKSYVPSWFSDDTVPELFCLSGRVIRSERVPYHTISDVPPDVFAVPPSFDRFLRMQHEQHCFFN